MGHTKIPDQPDDIESDSFDLPDPVKAAKRVNTFLAAYGDGIVTSAWDDSPRGRATLYARDLQALVNEIGPKEKD